MAYEGLNTAYAVAAEEMTTAYPAIQANEYRPRNSKESIRLCLSEDSFNMLDEQYTTVLGGAPDYSIFGEEQVQIFLLPKGVRFVALGIPKMFAIGKEDGKIDYLKRGEKLREANKVTITRIPLLMLLPDGSLVMDGERPQIFTLKLKSSKTKLVGGDIKDAEYRSLASLQKGLQKAFSGMRGQSLVHLVSVDIQAKPEKFSNGTDSSMGVMFTLEGGAKVLSDDHQKLAFELVQDEEVQALIADPFGLKRNPQNESTDLVEDEASETTDDYDDIPF